MWWCCWTTLLIHFVDDDDVVLWRRHSWGGALMVTPTSQSPHLHILIIPTLMIISRTMILILMITKSWFKKEFKIPSLIIKVHRFSDQLMFTCWHSYNLLFLLFYHQPGLRDGGPIALLASWGHTSVKTNSLSFNKSWKQTHCHLVTYLLFPSFCWGMFKNNNQHLPDTSFDPTTWHFWHTFVKTFCC